MTELNQLQNFPFDSMEDLSKNFKAGIAEPVVPRDFARQWATHSPLSKVKRTTTIFFAMPLLLVIGMIILANYSETIKWYHALIISIISLIAFNPMAILTLGIFRKLLIYATIGFTIYLFIIGNWEFGVMFLLALGMLLFYELTYLVALREIVDNLLTDRELLTELWNKKIVAIRFTNGNIVNVDKTINRQPDHERTTSPLQ